LHEQKPPKKAQRQQPTFSLSFTGLTHSLRI
jgi:hypothetical protein